MKEKDLIKLIANSVKKFTGKKDSKVESTFGFGKKQFFET